jgi:hypothetical protein
VDVTEVMSRVRAFADESGSTLCVYLNDEDGRITHSLTHADLNALCDAVEYLKDVLETIASIQERGPDTVIARVQQAYDMRCVARAACGVSDAS